MSAGSGYTIFMVSGSSSSVISGCQRCRSMLCKGCWGSGVDGHGDGEEGKV